MTSLSLEISCSNLIISLAEVESRLPVGSSAIKIGVSLAKALAMATLCFCPPDNFDTLVFLYLVSPTFLINYKTFALTSLLVFPLINITSSI
ncbi:MAG: hypothetical protein SO108_05450, partial [Bacilli bacterium]|nr:hypothetical protein [Bacilli bacterium]